MPRDAERDFPAAARLRHRAEFDAVMRRGRKIVVRELVAWLRPAAEGVTRPRLGLSVSRKVGDSPERNRVKRVLRAAFCESAATWSEPLDVVLLARPGASPRSLAAARDALAAILLRYARPPRAAGAGRTPAARRQRSGPPRPDGAPPS